ncbi:hypothetical protein ACHAXA_011650 [Cyclostephanos tholiformis]|uniref:Peptidylprolyl isomerase n=1 Tax=Cyclostephanos tholiformis TaxID=382380 RepID=A0ABD3SEG7_9STRA
MSAVATIVLLLLVSVPRNHAFQPHPSLRRGVLSLRSTAESTEVITGPITGTKTNIKYPTARGSQVDSRLIVDYRSKNRGVSGPVASSSPLIALRLSHILFASHELAAQTLERLTKAEWDFEEMAKVVSNCVETREEGGGIGWVNLSEDFSADDNIDGSVPETITNPNKHLDLILPPSARKQILSTPTKPGDIILVESYRGVHLVQVVDIMIDVRKLSYLKAKRTEKLKGDTVIIQNEMELVKNSDRNDFHAKGNKLASVLGCSLSRDKLDLTYKIETMGCQMNLSDSERIEGQLMKLGIRPLDENEMIEVQIQTKNGGSKTKQQKKEPDVVVLNTCSIRDHAEQKVYSYLGPHTKRKRAGEDITIIVAGCVAQQEGQSLLRRIPEIDLVMGPQYANRIGDLLEDVANGNQVVATEVSHIMEDSTKPRRQSSTCAWVNVIYGCNERCTYCIVPTTRGVEQSRPVESIVDEVKELVSQGFKEVTLLGQNIDAYGRDMIPKRKFSDLLRIVGDTPGLERLRFVTSHPRYMSLGCIDAVADTKSACEYFHIPFQSGSNDILKAMGRGHTREKFLQIIDRVRERLPDAGISADVIVGFPGETEQDFLDTLSIMNKVKFDNVNTAAYSPRPNTPAANWNNQVSEDVKQDRLRRINELNLKHATERRARMMDRVVEVLVEERNVKVPTQVMGRTTHNYIVYLDGDIDKLRGKLVNVKVEKCQRYYLVGKITEEEVTKANI